MVIAIKMPDLDDQEINFIKKSIFHKIGVIEDDRHIPADRKKQFIDEGIQIITKMEKLRSFMEQTRKCAGI